MIAPPSGLQLHLDVYFLLQSLAETTQDIKLYGTTRIKNIVMFFLALHFWKDKKKEEELETHVNSHMD